MYALDNDKPKTPAEIVNIIAGDIPPLEKVPLGKKENVFILLNKERNINKQGNGNKNEYFDDCGAWEKKKSHRVKTHFLIDEQWTNIFKVSHVILKENVVHTEKGSKEKRN